MINTIKTVTRRGWTNFKRNRYLSFAATSVMALALILFLGLLALQYLTAQIVVSLENKVDISAYFKTETPEEQILRVKSDLTSRPEVASVNYISRAQALADFKAKHAADTLIQESLQQLDENPLTASLNIKTKTTTQYAAIAGFLESGKFRSFIDKISFYENKTVIEKIDRLSGAIKSWGLAIVLLLALVAVLVTFNTIRLTIFNQKPEIEIMRLVGASNWHIRGPFLAEGGFYGLFAALIALVIFYPIIYFVSDKLANFAENVDLAGYFLHGAWQVMLITAGLGILLGVTSSFIAIRKHLQT